MAGVLDLTPAAATKAGLVRRALWRIARFAKTAMATGDAPFQTYALAMANLVMRGKIAMSVDQITDLSMGVARSVRRVKVERAIAVLTVTAPETLMGLFAIVAKMDSTGRRASRYPTWSVLYQMTLKMSAAYSFGSPESISDSRLALSSVFLRARLLSMQRLSSIIPSSAGVQESL
jgi:hypothetical protein